MALVTIHVTILSITIAIILYSDHEAFSWVRGKKEVLDGVKMKHLHYAVWAGLLGMIGTGMTMMWPIGDVLWMEPLFRLKMFFVALLVVNAFFIGKFSHIATERSFASLTTRERMPLLASGAISTIAWVGALLSALTLF